MNRSATIYEIRIRGRIGPQMQHLLGDLEPTLGRGATLLHTGSHDQAELHGVLARVRDLGLEIEYVATVSTPP